MQNDFYNIEFVGIDAYGRAFIISREDAERFFQNQEIEENKSSESQSKSKTL